MHWIRWEALTEIKKHGGMGFREMQKFNEALLSKMGWRILQNPDMLCSKVLKGIYFPFSSFMEAKQGTRASWIWSSLLKGREVLKKGCRWHVRSGSDINIWSDLWIPTLPEFKTTSQKPDEVEIYLVKDLLEQGTGEWNLTLLNQLFSHQEQVAIQKIPACMGIGNDKMIWHHDNKGQYSVKSGYKMLKQQARENNLTRLGAGNSQRNNEIWSSIWHLKIPPKVRVFLWKCSWNALATNEALKKRGCRVEGFCKRCGTT